MAQPGLAPSGAAAGKNPPYGASIQYWLKEKVKDPSEEGAGEKASSRSAGAVPPLTEAEREEKEGEKAKKKLVEITILDPAGEKVSKSRGGLLHMDEVAREFGADVARLWVASVDYHEDVSVSRDLLRKVGESYRRIRNTFRWILGNLEGFDPAAHSVADADLLEGFGFNLNRRISGGGAVLNSATGEITYSIVLRENDPRVASDPTESYRYLCHGLVEALAELGIKASFKPINDIVVGPRKISGNAQIRRYGAVLHHGTLLVDFNAREMFGVLKISKEKLSDKMIQQAEERVTTIRRELGREICFSDVRNAFESGYRKALNAELVKGELTQYEAELVEDFREKYSNPYWIHRR